MCFRGLHSRSRFLGTEFFPGKFGNFPVPSIREHPLPGPVSVPPFGTGQLPSRLSPENETGIPEFEISGKFGKNSRNSVLDGKFPVGYWNMLYKSRPNKTTEKKFLLGAEIWNKKQDWPRNFRKNKVSSYGISCKSTIKSSSASNNKLAYDDLSMFWQLIPQNLLY